MLGTINIKISIIFGAFQSGGTSLLLQRLTDSTLVINVIGAYRSEIASCTD
ncbi:hypothetical protein IE4771_PB00160 (plasmid) [Rhizobium etli bv. mimosae str. IE4771]|uniref:Uncharacterized protein n=1 Tax=Rhizobium etli bv. mimosae str. IE4771 TaxID=1432050 RepID=A0A060IDV3_RHIET|nr:hypothetical protein IE4771_PB00160 [Rhizobium sp. IE4771]